MCKKHWYSLDSKLRDAIWKEYRVGQEIDKKASNRYLAVRQWSIGMTAFKPNDENAALITSNYLFQAQKFRQLSIDAGNGDPLEGIAP